MKNLRPIYMLLLIVFCTKAEAQQSACATVASAPTGTQNYVISNTIKDSIKLESQISALTNCQLNQTIQYFDGLGRPLQTVQVKASPLGKDIVVPIAYDAFGREDTRYQPYADPGTANGSYRPSAIASQLSFYTSATGSIRKSSYPFSKTVYEASPLNRVLEQGAPGNIYQPGPRVTAGGRTVVTDYLVNDAADVRYFQLTATGIVANGTYAAGTLYKIVSKDENWISGKANTSEEYKDLEGRVVMKKAWQTSTVSLNTYYVYDDFGNLRYVIPPFPGSASITTLNETDDLFKKYCYGYHYDGRNRLIDKKIPGKDVDYIVYNTLDQVVLTQDPKQRTEHKWAFTKYDALGRTIVTGLLINPQSIDSVRKLVNKQTVLWETWGTDLYTTVAFPQVFNYYYQAFFYDDYKFPVPKLYGMAGASKKTKGLLTQVATFVMATASYMVEINHYDDYGRVIKNFKQHYASSTIDSLNYDETTNAYSFAGELKSSTRVHYKRGATNTTVAMAYEYDAWGRRSKTREKINADAQVLLSENLYNEIGGLQEKQLHNGLQKTQFTYIERGWFLTKSSNEFSESLKYVDSVGSRLYNGNIPYVKWGYSRATPNVFSYTYDGLNRLTKATTNTSAPLNETISYDTMGNIDSLNRNGVGGRYTNSGNQLTKITGGLGTDPYVYDANGNMTTDGRNKTTIAYNMLSLPLTVSKTGLTINYLYSADGAKLEKKSNATGTAITTHYVDGIQYTGSNIDFIQTEEGLARRNGTSYSYEYNLTDHLGNVRLTFNQNPTTGAIAVLQKDDYFAFGKRSAVQAGSNKYLYNGKELQEELETYDYGARFYDPVIARWTSVDPLAEMDRRWSPYTYTFGDPIRFTDPDGMWPDGDGPGVLSVTGNFLGGLGQSALGTVTGVYGVVRHPINTATAIGSAVAHPINTAKAIGNAVSQGYDDFQSGNADVKANIAGKVIGDVAQLFVGAGEVKAAVNGLRGTKVADEAGQIAKVVDDVADATGFGPKADPIRMQGPWTKGDLARAAEGKGPVDFMPTVNKSGKKMPLELHHGDQMPGSAIHEVPPAHSGTVPHPNKFNQGVTPLMRQQDSQLHWYMRGLEMGNK